MTVQELIDILDKYDKDMPIVLIESQNLDIVPFKESCMKQDNLVGVYDEKYDETYYMPSMNENDKVLLINFMQLYE